MKLNWIGIGKVKRAKDQKLYALSSLFQDHFGNTKIIYSKRCKHRWIHIETVSL